MSKLVWGGIAAFAVIGIVIWALAARSSTAGDLSALEGKQMTLYRTLSCGCCGVYSRYVDGSTKASYVENDVPDMAPVRARYAIPPELSSCHTMIVDGYFIEGHVPLEAVAKLVREHPSDVKGIALPGMPSGSPGMPGAKQGPFVIQAVHADGSITEFMQV